MRGRPIVAWLSVVLSFPGAAAWGAEGKGAAQRAAKNEECLGCHEDSDDVLGFKDGSERSIGISVKAWKGSVHGTRLTCTQCHRDITDYPHPDRSLESARAYRLSHAEGCKQCHYAYYTRVLDGVHYELIEKGSAAAPTCVDCHGAHDIQDPRSSDSSVDQRCGACHEEIARIYERSVHGQATTRAKKGDVPTCSDCHGAHAIRDPRPPTFRLTAHTICAPCHGDAERMERYGLSTNVLRSYLNDFHGASNVLYASSGEEHGKPMATCIDCHGSHEIRSTRRDGASEARERLQATCAKCHENATPSFTDAWLSHYEPTLASAPLVWGVDWAYRILIPLMVLGLVLHVLLHLWRVGGRRGGSES